MITYDMIIESQNYLVEDWGVNGKAVIEECHKVNPFNKPFSIFLKECTACGGNWGGMFLTGIEALYPNVYNYIPSNMGVFAFRDICAILVLCGVDTSE